MHDDSVNTRNPTGIRLTQEQMDESFRQSYWAFAIRYGLQYYVAGRFATANRFTPVCANLLHHAVELLLKACLSSDDSLQTIEKYGHAKGDMGTTFSSYGTRSRRGSSPPDQSSSTRLLRRCTTSRNFDTQKT